MRDWDRKEKDRINDTLEDMAKRLSFDIIYDSELTPLLARGLSAKFKPRLYGLILLIFGDTPDKYIMDGVRKGLDERQNKTGVNHD